MIQFFVPGPLPGLNEIIAASKREVKHLRRGKKRVYEYKIMKDLWTDRVVNYYLEWNGQARKPLDFPVVISYLWFEKDNRRDPGNILVGSKFVEDGLVKAGVIVDDSRRWVKGVIHEFEKNDPKRPGVHVTVYNFNVVLTVSKQLRERKS